MAKYPMIHVVYGQVEPTANMYTFVYLSNQTGLDIDDISIFILPNDADLNGNGIIRSFRDYPRLIGMEITPETGTMAEPKFWASTQRNNTTRPTIKAWGGLTAASTHTLLNGDLDDAAIIAWRSLYADIWWSVFKIMVVWGWLTGEGRALKCGDAFSVSHGVAYPTALPHSTSNWYRDANNHRFTTGDDNVRPNVPKVQGFGPDWVMTAQNVEWIPEPNDVHRFNGQDDYIVSSAYCYEVGGINNNIFPGIWGGAAANKPSGVYVTL